MKGSTNQFFFKWLFKNASFGQIGQRIPICDVAIITTSPIVLFSSMFYSALDVC